MDSNIPLQSFPHKGKILLIGGAIVATILTVTFSSAPLPKQVVKNGVPIPFATESSNLQGSITSIGTRGGIEVFEVTFTTGADVARMNLNSIYLVHIPSSSSIVNAPIDNVLHHALPGQVNVNYFGYRYADAAARLERRDQFATRFADRFPGQFFASAKARAQDAANGNALAGFEDSADITFLPTSGNNAVRIDSAGSLYVFVINEDAGADLNPYLHGTCGNGVAEGLEICDDGNTDNTDACRNDCTAGIPIPFQGGSVSSVTTSSSSASTSAGQSSSAPASASSLSNDHLSSSASSASSIAGTPPSGATSSESDTSSSAASESASASASESNSSGTQSSSASVTASTSNTSSSAAQTPNSSAGIQSSAAAPFCGDGNIDDNEECDDGNQVETDDCSNACLLTVPLPPL